MNAAGVSGTSAQTHAPLFVRATAPGSAGIATLILDGDDVGALLANLFTSKRPLAAAVTGDLLFGRLTDARGAVIDEVVAAPVGRKDSETGNGQVELSCHGGEGVVSAVEESLVTVGFMRGRPTELLERAHLNGKLSLIEIEARLRLPAAATARQAEFLLGHALLRQQWEKLGFDMALGMRSRELAWREPLLRETEAALARLPAALRLLAQHHVVLAGPVNAGKSTLANRLAGADRHIVSAVPGTTRDRLDTPIELHGMSVLLTDTAGLRDAHDAVEREGQRRAREAAGRASVLVFVLDGSQAPSEAVLEFIRHSVAAGAVLPVLNKSDLGLDEDARGLGFLTGREPVALSATTGAGCDTLAEVLERELLGEVAPQPGAPFTRRHERLLTKLREGLQSGTSGSELLGWLRKLIGHRPDAEELAEVMAESER